MIERRKVDSQKAHGWKKYSGTCVNGLPDGRCDLAQRGPASARAMWVTAKDALAQQYGSVTVEDLLREFETLQK